MLIQLKIHHHSDIFCEEIYEYVHSLQWREKDIMCDRKKDKFCKKKKENLKSLI